MDSSTLQVWAADFAAFATDAMAGMGERDGRAASRLSAGLRGLAGPGAPCPQG